MDLLHRSIHAIAVGLITSLLVATVAVADVTPLRSPGCRVRNLTQQTRGDAFAAMISAARDGDRLLVRGLCRSQRVTVRADVAISGADHGAVLDAEGHHKVLRIARGAVVTLRDLVVTGGVAGPRTGVGGGIRNDGTLTLVGITVAGNRAEVGGGIFNARGRLVMVDSVVQGNRADYGGGIANRSFAMLTLVRTTLEDNVARAAGGGLSTDGRTVLVESTVERNTARSFGGGGIYAYEGTLTLADTRVTFNTAAEGGGGIDVDQARLVIDGATVVTDNTPTDCSGSTACAATR